ncbi:MAG: glycosyltransferase [Faecousia sp.]
MNSLSKISVVLPSLDPDEKLIAVVDGLLEVGFTDIILVNDGSKPENLHYFTDLAAAHPEIHLLHHEVNKGKGAALKNAFRWFLENRPDAMGVVTVDGDNQHHPKDTKACALRMMESGSLILGVRDFSGDDVPARSSTGNRITSFVFKVFVGMKLSDTQTGLRAIPARYLKTLTEIKGERFEYETNMLLAMKDHKIPYEEVKIRTVYIEENKSSHFHAIKDSWRIYKLIFAHFFKFLLSSVFAWLLDSGLYALFTALLNSVLADPWLIYIPAGCSRILSSLANFCLNKKLVFHSGAKAGKALVRYAMLAVLIWAGQAAITQGIYALFHIRENQVILRTVIYGCAQIPLFILSYHAQRRWVFAEEKED